MIRLLKPLEYYEEKYGTWMYGLNKLYLLMEKQHNRGQEGAGLACVKLERTPARNICFANGRSVREPSTRYSARCKATLKTLRKNNCTTPAMPSACSPLRGRCIWGICVTHGKSGLSYVHPFLRRNNWRAKNLALCGNFNLTNVDEIFARITAIGQHPRKYADTYIMLEQVGHRLDREVERLFNLAEAEGWQAWTSPVI